MGKSSRNTRRKESETYRDRTLRPLNCLLFVLPMLVFFQAGTAICGTTLLAPRDLHKLLRYFGATAAFLPALFVVAALLAQHLLRKDPWKAEPKVLSGMLGESVLWMVPLIVLSQLAGRLAAHQAVATAPAADGLLQQILLAFGAGIYEEFIFRLVFVSLVMILFVDVFELKREPVAVAAVVVGAVMFSLYHFSAAELTGDTLPWGGLIFRWLAGVYLGGLFVFRGFGIAVGAHAFYNVYAAIANFQFPIGN